MADIVNLYKTKFDARKYAEYYYNSDIPYEQKTRYIDFLHRLFSQGQLPGKTLVEIGCASTIQGAISSSSSMDEIYLTELTESGREEIDKWLRGDKDALDFSWQLKYVAKLEGHNDYKRIEERIRRTVKGVIPSNVLNNNPLDPKTAVFDVVISSLCLDALTDIQDYFQAVKNICSLLKPGGRVALLGTVNCSSYRVGDIDFPTLNKDSKTVKQAVEEADLEILEFNEYLYKEKLVSPIDTDDIFTILAVKP